MPHRQVVLTLPKRLRAYFLHDRRRLGLLSQVASHTLRDYVQAALGERHAVPGVIACVQTFGSLAHVHPHLHVLMTDGGFRRDGTFVPLPPDPTVLEELWRYADVHRFSALEFIARWLDPVPERYEVTVRYAGAYATRRRVWRRRRGVVLAGARGEPPGTAEREHAWPARRARRRRWADRLRRVFRVDVEVCARCGGAARIIGVVTEHSVITRILAHLAQRGVDARAGPWIGAAAAPG